MFEMGLDGLGYLFLVGEVLLSIRVRLNGDGVALAEFLLQMHQGAKALQLAVAKNGDTVAEKFHVG